MSGGTVPSFDTHRPLEPAIPSRGRRLFRASENLLLVIPLGAMLLLPVLEILLRTIFKTGISGSSAIVQHLTLIVGMLGGAIAARDRRLLALSPVQTLLKGRAKAAASCGSREGFARRSSRWSRARRGRIGGRGWKGRRGGMVIASPSCRSCPSCPSSLPPT